MQRPKNNNPKDSRVSGLASLASAFYLIKYAGPPGGHITSNMP